MFPGFWIPPGVCLVFFNVKGTKSPDFNPFPLSQCVGYFIKKQVYDRLGVSDLDRWFESFSAWMRSILFVRSPFLKSGMIWNGKDKDM